MWVSDPFKEKILIVAKQLAFRQAQTKRKRQKGRDLFIGNLNLNRKTVLRSRKLH